jgi:hypothetical protein
MTWRLPGEFDAGLRKWVAEQGWCGATPHPVGEALITGWQIDGDHALYVGRQAIEDYSNTTELVDKFISELDRLDVATTIKNDPKAYTIVIRPPKGDLEVVQRQEPPP